MMRVEYSYLWENSAFTYYIRGGEQVTDTKELDALAMAMGLR